MKTIFITGAASGIGREGARTFHARGWRVGAVDRDDDGLASLIHELGDAFLWTRALSVTDKCALNAAIADFCGSTEAVDMMWNNAGIGESGWYEDVPYDAAMRVLETNLRAVLIGAYSALPYLKRSPNSLMLSTSSSAAIYGMPCMAVYSAAKHAVTGLTEALSAEWDRHGVRVADLLPGLVETPILLQTPNRSTEVKLTMDDIRAHAPKRGMMRLMPPSAVAHAAWQAYHHPTRIHWYVPKSLRWFDCAKTLSPQFVRARILKSLGEMTSQTSDVSPPA